ncbi:beta-galactosidase [Arthrobacter cryoconiti]|uniref:Beta-galactosidase n=1 Tax=Arthrobacter cryoconiti TaxID=748907 RepID=A0ABV8QY95_9MICC
MRRHDKPHRIIAGAMHYFRIHPDQWQDRIERLVSMGVNTLDTYVAWNFHQPAKGIAPDFDGPRDLTRFIRLAGEAGLDVIVRPGPYICAEWDNGGFPAWVTADPRMVLRSSDPLFIAAVESWFDVLIPVLAPLQWIHGGPIVALQVENEYGSYGDDARYLRWNRKALLDRGITEMLFTADGGTDYFLDGGSLPEVWAAATLGSRGEEADATWKRRRPGEPFFTVEFWNGWFDHWGEDHHTRDAQDASAEVKKILDLSGSVCLYMAHGGTNFGLTAGANHDGVIQPTVTSYDSDAPIGEDGSLGEKYHAMREIFFQAQGRDLTPVPDHLQEQVPVLDEQCFEMAQGVSLLDFVRAGEAVVSVKPLSFEELGLDRGLVHYQASAVLPRGGGFLKIGGLHDRAYVWIGGRYVGVLHDGNARDGIAVPGDGNLETLEILVENQGRINYGPFLGQGKGILEGVFVNQRLVFHWEQRVVNLERPLTQLLAATGNCGFGDVGSHAGGPGQSAAVPGFFHGQFHVSTPADTHLALPGFGKGVVWINGFLLGRFWDIGPQVTLYIPSPLLVVGTNIVTVLDYEGGGTYGQLRNKPDLGIVGVSHVEDLS